MELAFSEIHTTKIQQKEKMGKLLGYKENLRDILDIEITKTKDKLIARNKEYKYNYKSKIYIINNQNINIKELKHKRLELKNKRVESIINKAIIKEKLGEMEKIRDKYKVEEERRIANREEIQKALDEDGLSNAGLANISKILRGTRYNFHGIIIEQGKAGQFVYENPDGSWEISDNEIKEKKCILKKNDDVLVRHLEYKHIDPKIMEQALKESVAFYDKRYEEYMKNVKYLESGSRFRNEDFRKFYKKITGTTGKIRATREWTKKALGAKFFIEENFRSKENDRFIQIQGIEKEKKGEKMEEIKKWILRKKGIIGEPTLEDVQKVIIEWKQEQAEELVELRNKSKRPKINTRHIARALYGPIPTSICVIPIENIKKIS